MTSTVSIQRPCSSTTEVDWRSIGTTVEKLIATVAGALGVPASALALGTAADEIEAWDSLGHINVISEVEAEFGVSIPIEKVADIRCIRDFLPYLGEAT